MPYQKPSYVLWLDPGEMTGWALWYTEQQHLFTAEYDRKNIGTYLERWLSTGGGKTVLGCEKYIITPETARLSQQPASLEVIGIARELANKYPVVEFRCDQSSSTAKTFCTNQMLKAIGWYRVGMRHANDASRHLFLYLSNTHQLSDDMLRKAFQDLGTIG